MSHPRKLLKTVEFSQLLVEQDAIAW